MPGPPTLLVMAPALTRDLITDAHRARLAALCELRDPEPIPGFDDPRAAPHLKDVELLVTCWGCPPIGAELLDRMPSLRAIFHAAGTVKGHVAPTVYERGVRVTSAAYANGIPVAEFTLAAILLAGKRAFRASRRYAEVKTWRPWSRDLPGMGNYGRTVGLVGASRIGRMVAAHLRPFDFELRIHDPFLSPEEARALGCEWMELDPLLAACDVVSLHAPALPSTHHMIDRRRLALLPDGAVLVNTARGALVDHEALTAELVSGRIDAVIDTTDPEILPADSPLYDLPNVFLTPHIAGSQGRETQRMMSLALDELERFTRGEPLQHEVRLEDLERIA